MISAGSIHTASKHGQPAAMIMFRGPSARLIYWTIPVLNLALIAAVRESAFLAQSGHGDREDGSLLSGVKRTSRLSDRMSAFDPKQTWSVPLETGLSSAALLNSAMGQPARTAPALRLR